MIRSAARAAVVVWSAVTGLISLVITALVIAELLRGPTNSGDVPETLPSAMAWSAVISIYYNVLALPFVVPSAVLVGWMAAWVVARRRRTFRR